MAINRKDVVTRTAVGAVYVFIMGVCTLLSWWTTLAVVCVTAGLCVWEFLSMAKSAGMHPYRSIGTVSDFFKYLTSVRHTFSPFFCVFDFIQQSPQIGG